MPTLDIRDLTVNYAVKGGMLQALAPVNLKMNGGDFVVALGASGCGKTTLLNCIAGFLPPLERRDPARRQAGRRARRRPRRRVPEARADALALRCATTSPSACACAASTGPSARARSPTTSWPWSASRSTRDRAVYELSGGMQQRVGIARALANDPAVLLMDEPMGALDAFTREQVQEILLRAWAATNKMVFFITHVGRGGAVPRDRPDRHEPEPGAHRARLRRHAVLAPVPRRMATRAR